MEKIKEKIRKKIKGVNPLDALSLISRCIIKFIMDNDQQQMDIDDCLVENARKVSESMNGKPYIGDVNFPKMVGDLVRIIDLLKKDKEELREALLRNAKE